MVGRQWRKALGRVPRMIQSPVKVHMTAPAAQMPLGNSSLLKRCLSNSTSSTLRHNFADPRIGIGYLQLSPEETDAEEELLRMLPEFQQSMQLLQSVEENGKKLTNSAKSAKAIPPLERTVDICRSAMGHQSVYLLAALRHLFQTYYMQGNYEMANKVMMERGEIMGWPISEQERIVRLFLRENQPLLAQDWCEKDTFTKLFPKDETMPLKWSMYELISESLQKGPSKLKVDDPLFTSAVEVLRSKKYGLIDEGASTEDSLLSHEIPYLMAQYGALCLVASDSLFKPKQELSDMQLVSLNQAEVLWKEALEWVDRTSADKDDQAAGELELGIDACFEAYVQTNLGELLLQKKKPEEAMEHLGKALQIQQRAKGTDVLALSRVLSKIAKGCHVLGQAVSSEGLLTSVLESYEKESFLSTTDKVQYARALRAYGDLLANWEKREPTAQRYYDHADRLQQEIQQSCEQTQSLTPLHPVFYLPL